MKVTNLLGRLSAYFLLATGSAVFLYPFVWMAMASFKLDREMFGEEARFFPTSPEARGTSPYVQTAERQEENAPAVKGVLEALGKPGVLPAWPAGIPVESATVSLAERLAKRVQQISGEQWPSENPQANAKLLASLLTSSMIASERAGVLRALVLGDLVLRSRDVQQERAVVGEECESRWEIGGTARGEFLQSSEFSGQGRLLSYDFTGGKTLRLSTEWSPGFDLKRLLDIQLSIRPDDTWHAVNLEVETGGALYRSVRPYSLGDITWRTFAWRFPGPEDQSNMVKNWILLREVERGNGYESRPGQMKLTLVLTQRSTWGAWMAKLQRNYRLVLEQIPFARYVATSLFLVLLQLLGTLFSCSLVAYSFARLRWPGRSFCFLVMLGTMMLPSQVTMIPYFLIIRELGWYNTLLPLWVPSFFANAFYVFLLYQFMKGIPRDLEDAAAIDGCGVLRIYWHVMLPLLKPSLAAIGIFTFMGVWNDFMAPLIFLQDQRLYPVSLGLYALNVQNNGGMGMMMAGSLLMTLPVILLFLFAQRYFLQGITLTGMK